MTELSCCVWKAQRGWEEKIELVTDLFVRNHANHLQIYHKFIASGHVLLNVGL